jgi:hypothetical protein
MRVANRTGEKSRRIPSHEEDDRPTHWEHANELIEAPHPRREKSRRIPSHEEDDRPTHRRRGSNDQSPVAKLRFS